MPTIYRISRPDSQDVEDVDSVEAIQRAVRRAVPVRYHIDEIGSDPLPSGHTSRRRGTAIKRPGGQCTLGPNPWPDR